MTSVIRTGVGECSLAVELYRKRRGWTAWCPHLKTMGYSDVSPEEAIEDFKTNVLVFFKVQDHYDILEKTLANLGWDERSPGVFDNTTTIICIGELRRVETKIRS